MRPEDLPVDYVLKRRDIVAEARKWVGVPYRHQGRGARGIDCVGLLIEVANGVGHPGGRAERLQHHAAGLAAARARATTQLWKPARQDRLIPGDLAVFWGWNRPSRSISPSSASTPGGMTIIHSFSKFDKVVEQSWNRLWAKKFHCLYNLPGTEESLLMAALAIELIIGLGGMLLSALFTPKPRTPGARVCRTSTCRRSRLAT